MSPQTSISIGDWTGIILFLLGSLGTLYLMFIKATRALLATQMEDMRRHMDEGFDNINRTLAQHSKDISDTKLDVTELRGVLKGQGCLSQSYTPSKRRSSDYSSPPCAPSHTHIHSSNS